MTKDQIKTCLDKAIGMDNSLKDDGHGHIMFGRFDMGGIFRRFLEDFYKLYKERDSEHFLNYLHEKVGICGHCGKRNCAGRSSNSRLPENIPSEIIIAAIEEIK